MTIRTRELQSMLIKELAIMESANKRLKTVINEVVVDYTCQKCGKNLIVAALKYDCVYHIQCPDYGKTPQHTQIVVDDENGVNR